MIMDTRDKEITDQPRLNHFDLKSNSTCNIYIASAKELNQILHGTNPACGHNCT